jgi:hypothetical protein
MLYSFSNLGDFNGNALDTISASDVLICPKTRTVRESKRVCRRIIVGFIATISILDVGQSREPDGAASSGSNAIAAWRLTIPPGKAIVPLVGPDEQLWMVGQKYAWSSRDGIHWDAQAKSDWGERAGMAFASFNGKLWMLGGMSAWDDFKNDVWCSDDGKEWKQVAVQAAWHARRNHAVAVFKQRLWVVGGAQSSGHADQVPTRFYNDVWSSGDGIHWTQESVRAPWQARDGHACLVHHGKLWVVGGTGRNDVWLSENGRDWTAATRDAEWGARTSNGTVALSEQLWVFGGRELNDVWRSSDGSRWQKVDDHAPWSPRTTIHSVVFNDRLWIYGGKTGREDSWAGDVWTMTAETSLR